MAHPDTADKAPSLDSLCDALRAFVVGSASGPSSFHDFELALWRLLLSPGRAAVADFLAARGPGDLGESVTLPDGKATRRLDGARRRELTCVFGTFTLERFCYAKREGQRIDLVPSDDRLDLPQGRFSYLSQDFNGLLAAEQPFASVACALERILGLEQHVDGLERQTRHVAAFAGPFRDGQPAPPHEEEGPILVRTADAEGVVMRKGEGAPPEPPGRGHKRGPRPGRKKQAVLGCVYSASPVVRTAEEVVESLSRRADPDVPRPPRPQIRHERVIAPLNEYADDGGEARDGMAEAFAWMDSQLDERDPTCDEVMVNVSDGDERLKQRKESSRGPGGADVPDLLHVMERVWEVAALLHARESAECEGQVRAWLLEILRGQVRAVARDVGAKGEGLGGEKGRALSRARQYPGQNAYRMRYQEYLRAGYPIASGVIEGACRHYVKDRMERAGMSWSQQGARAMLALRAVASNGDWDDFQSFYRRQQSSQLHPHRALPEQIVWPSAA